MRAPEIFPGVRAEDFTPRPALIYDGECGFCSAWVRRARRWARREFTVTAAAEARHRLPAAVAATLAEQVVWVEADGTVWGGSRALAKLLEQNGRPVLAAALANRLVAPVAWLAYRFIARIRHRLHGGRGTGCPI